VLAPWGSGLARRVRTALARRDETLRGGIVTVSDDKGGFVEIAAWYWQALDAVARRDLDRASPCSSPSW